MPWRLGIMAVMATALLALAAPPKPPAIPGMADFVGPVLPDTNYYTNIGVNVVVTWQSVSRYSNDSCQLSWDAVANPNVAGYEVYYTTDTNDDWDELFTGTNTSWWFSNLIGGSNYFFQVAPCDANNDPFPTNSAIVSYLAKGYVQLTRTQLESWTNIYSPQTNVYAYNFWGQTNTVLWVAKSNSPVLYGSADLQHWTPIETVSVTSNTLETFIDNSNGNQYFYSALGRTGP